MSEQTAEDARQERWREAAEDRESLRADLEIDLEASEAEAKEREEFEAAADVRADLRHTLGADTGAAVSEFLRLDETMRRDPAAGAEAMVQRGLSLPRRPPRENEEKPDPSDLRALLAYSLDDARDADAKDYAESREAVAELRNRYPDLSEREALERIRDTANGMIENPFVTAERVGAGYGLPLTPRQHQEAGLVGSAEQVLHRYGLDNHTDDVADELERMTRDGQRSSDPMADLHHAVGIVKARLDHAHNAKRAAVSVR